VVKNGRLKQKAKNISYIAAFTCFFCFVIFYVHRVFFSFVCGIYGSHPATVIYGSYKLTTVTTLLSLLLKLISESFICWSSYHHNRMGRPADGYKCRQIDADFPDSLYRLHVVINFERKKRTREGL
jgi:hypothetical protein